jgi:hypothetical protein
MAVPGVATTTVTLDEELVRIYSRDKLFEPCERSKPRFWNQMKEAKDIRPGGSGLRFRIIGALGHSNGNPDEGGDWSASRVRVQVECVVVAARIDSTVELSTTFMEAAEGEGSYGGDAEHESILETTTDFFSYADRLLGCGHGTGRLAVVGATSTGTTITLAAPERAFQLRRNQPIDFVDTDTGGTVQASRTILSVNYTTATITVDSAVSVTANWGIYQSDVYGNAMPNGLRNLVDDGDLSSTYCGVSRTPPNDFLNAKVMDGSGGLQDYSEELVTQLLDAVSWEQEFIPTQLRCNMGILSEHKRVTREDRVYTQAGPVPDYNTGANHEKLSFTYGAVKIPFEADRNLPARELYALHLPSWQKHTLRKADWMKTNGKILHLKPASGGETYAYAYVGAMMMEINISCLKPNAQGKLTNIRDRNGAGDSA